MLEDSGNEFRSRLPRRKSRLTSQRGCRFRTGYGIEIQECINWKVFAVVELFILLVSTVFPLLWVALAQSSDRVSTAFTIGQWCFALMNGIWAVGIVLAELVSSWKY